MKNYKRMDWDSGFFGFEVAMLIGDEFDEVGLKGALADLKTLGVSLVYWFTAGERKIASKCNGSLGDIKIIYSKRIIGENKIGFPLRSYSSTDKFERLVPLALQSGSYSRFKTDNNFLNGEFEKMYREWIRKSVDREIADEVFVLEILGKILGFITVYKRDLIGIVGLIAVDEEERGNGIGKSLLNYAENFVFKNGCNEIQVATQKENKIACLFYERNNYRIKDIKWIYHFWLNEGK